MSENLFVFEIDFFEKFRISQKCDFAFQLNVFIYSNEYVPVVKYGFDPYLLFLSTGKPYTKNALKIGLKWALVYSL